MTTYVLTAKAGDCTVYAEQRKTVGRAQVTDRREDASATTTSTTSGTRQPPVGQVRPPVTFSTPSSP